MHGLVGRRPVIYKPIDPPDFFYTFLLMSAVLEHTFFDQECFAGFGVHSDSEWDGISIPSSQTLLTYPHGLGLISKNKAFKSSPQGLLAYSSAPLPMALVLRERGYHSLSSDHFLSDYSCHVRFVTEAFREKAYSAPESGELLQVPLAGSCSSFPEPESEYALPEVDHLLPVLVNSSIHEITVPDCGSTTPLESKTFPTSYSPTAPKDLCLQPPQRRYNLPAVLVPGRGGAGHREAAKAKYRVQEPSLDLPPPQATPCPYRYESSGVGFSSSIDASPIPERLLRQLPVRAEEIKDLQDYYKEDYGSPGERQETSEEVLGLKGFDKTLKKTRVLSHLIYPKIKKELPFLVLIENHDARLEVKVRFSERNAFYKLYCRSQSTREYRQPIFRNLQTMLQLLSSDKFMTKKPLEDDPHVQVSRAEHTYLVTLRRFESRLTFQQMSHILGLQHRKVSLIRLIETNVILLFEQLCGLELSKKRWTKLERHERTRMVAYVYRYSKFYFPTLNTELLEIIMRRASYSKAQLELKCKRLNRKKSTRPG